MSGVSDVAICMEMVYAQIAPPPSKHPHLKGKLMAASYDFFLSCDLNQAKLTLGQAFEKMGYTVTGTPKGGLLAKRGSMKKTMWLGALAGKDFAMSLVTEFFQHSDGSQVARVNRDMASGALKGGAMGASKANNAYADAVNSLQQELQQAGVLRHVVNNAAS